MKYIATASTRIDLAGGTLDLNPLYLFVDRSLTVNASLNLRSRAVVESLPGNAVRLISEDLNETVEAANPDALDLGGTLGFVARAVKFYAPEGGVQVSTRSLAPKGSGLGASSSLLMSLSKALCAWHGSERSISEIIHFGGAIEAQSLGIPTGLQDYYGAVLGGINGLSFGVTGTNISTLHCSSEFFKQLEDGLVVSFTGISHFSGTNNWNMLKRFIDKDGSTVAQMEAIRDTAHHMWEALLAEDFAQVAKCLEQEWAHRRNLAEGVTTPQIDAMMQQAKDAGALASKLCGAGGGGCMITLVDPAKRREVEQALVGAGAELIDAGLDIQGLALEQVEEAVCCGG